VPALLESDAGHEVRCHIAPKERKRIFADQVKPTL
jgi:hypothetical protein